MHVDKHELNKLIENERKKEKKWDRGPVQPAEHNKHLEVFKNKHEGESAIIIVAGNSFLSRWSGKPDFPEYKNSIKFTTNRMIYLNKEVTDECDYFFCGSGLNTRGIEAWNARYKVAIDLRELVIDYCKRTPNCTKFGACYETSKRVGRHQSHKDINRGNLWPEDAEKFGIIPFENNLEYFTDDIAKNCTQGHSIIFPMVQFVLYMGFHTIYLLGVDGGASLPHFKDDYLGIMPYWHQFKKWYKGHTKIISINPVSLKGWFWKDIYYD